MWNPYSSTKYTFLVHVLHLTCALKEIYSRSNYALKSCILKQGDICRTEYIVSCCNHLVSKSLWHRLKRECNQGSTALMKRSRDKTLIIIKHSLQICCSGEGYIPDITSWRIFGEINIVLINTKL